MPRAQSSRPTARAIAELPPPDTQAAGLAPTLARQDYRRETFLAHGHTMLTAWLADPLYPWWGDLPPRIRARLAVHLPDDWMISCHHERWHALVYRSVIASAAPGSTVTLGGLVTVLAEAGVRAHRRDDFLQAALVGFLRHLHQVQFVQITPYRANDVGIPSCRVTDPARNPLLVPADYADAMVAVRAVRAQRLLTDADAREHLERGLLRGPNDEDEPGAGLYERECAACGGSYTHSPAATPALIAAA